MNKKLTDLTFNELRNKLFKCNDNLQEYIIRRIMKDKYIKYKLKEKELLERRSEKEYKIKEYKLENENDIINELVNNIEKNDKYKYKYKDNYKSLNREMSRKQILDLCENDDVNNNLMNRMNNERDIRMNKKFINKPNKHPLITPYSNGHTQYAQYNNNVNITDFNTLTNAFNIIN
uniref:Uncharacterized protein n=1 Tax=Mimivirus LCMiAC02 TaxID=2506609 RepID=A0A481Z286_9VIRU|nr:MAG: hypothetical protein LCMiAC02_02690 [Mimivirus LCMiAC02]